MALSLGIYGPPPAPPVFDRLRIRTRRSRGHQNRRAQQHYRDFFHRLSDAVKSETASSPRRELFKTRRDLQPAQSRPVMRGFDACNGELLEYPVIQSESYN